MQFVLFICTDPAGEPYDEASDDVEGWFSGLQERGRHLAGDRLRPVEDATTVRVRGGERLITDGPFAETREWIAGFDLTTGYADIARSFMTTEGMGGRGGPGLRTATRVGGSRRCPERRALLSVPCGTRRPVGGSGAARGGVQCLRTRRSPGAW